MTRTFIDMYAFYIPLRLLWSEFPQFISDPNASTTFPYVTDTWGFNFEKWHTSFSATAPNDRHPAFIRRAYNHVWYNFFASSSQTLSEDANTVRSVHQRASTLETRFVDVPGDVAAVTIDTSGATTDTDTIRAAFAQDQFNKLRAFYGDRYVDYLATLGVKTNWSVLEEPELIGQVHHDWNYRLIAATGGDPNAETSGS